MYYYLIAICVATSLSAFLLNQKSILKQYHLHSYQDVRTRIMCIPNEGHQTWLMLARVPLRLH